MMVSPRYTSAAPGDVVAFSSRLWHASGPNRSGQVRRVFYAQFSSRPLTDGSKDPSPISLAVPCGWRWMWRARLSSEDLTGDSARASEVYFCLGSTV